MTQIILDAGMRAKLRDLRESLDLCDESGTVLVKLEPVLDESQNEKVEPYISPEELRRRDQEPDFSTAEVIEYLKVS